MKVHYISFVLLILTLLPGTVYSNSNLCSAFCSPSDCNGPTSNDCTASCPTHWVRAGSICTLDPAFNYSLVAESADITGGSSPITITPSGSIGSCAVLNYYGDYDCSSPFTISVATGLAVPHYSFQMFMWVGFLDRTTWLTTDNITLTDGNTSQITSMSSFSDQAKICGTKYQTYYRLLWSQTHINQTSTPLVFTLSTDVAGSTCKWGLKQVVIIAKLCHNYCLTCYGSAATQCYSCATNYYLSGNTCGTSCPLTYGIDSSNGTCIQCDLKCQVCAELANNCSKCTTVAPNQAFLYGNQCLVSCPNTTCENITTHVCDSCPANCDICSSNIICTTCSSSYALLNGSCYSPCPSSYFLTNGTCTVCYSLCLNCFGVSQSDCTSCVNSSWLSNTTCDSVCLSNYGETSTAGQCLQCLPTCSVCSLVSDNCSACTTAPPNQAFLDSTNSSYPTCTTTCNFSTFADASVHQCLPCSVDCLTCSQTSTNCTSCPSPSGWLAFTCHDPCPSLYFLDGDNCTLCDSLCSVCEGISTNCSKCQTTSPNTAYLLSNSCMATCPDPYFEDSNSGAGPNLCLHCHSYCLSCLDATSTNCQSCSTNYTLSGSTCSSTCLSGYCPSLTPQVCIACTYPCLTCSVNPTNCTSCNMSNTTYYLYQYGCVLTCPSNTFVNVTLMACKNCPTGCLTCANSSYCYSCDAAGGYAWINTTYLCYNPCPVNYYKENTTNCSSCNVECRRCVNDPWNCTQCQTSGSQRSFLLGISCYQVCPAPNYGNTSTNTCKPCSSYCAICFAPTKNDCLLCNNPYVRSGTTCDSACAPLYGVTSDPFQCVSCEPQCLACSYLSTNCSSCESTGNFSSFLFPNSSTYSECLYSCPVGYFQNTTDQLCSPCTNNCSSCQLVSDNCTSCFTDWYKLGNQCYDTCPLGYFNDVDQCTSCSQYCLECQGAANNCSVCQYTGGNRSFLLNYTCLTNCGNGYYKWSGGTNGPTLCLPCSSNCTRCSSTATQCSQCASGYYFLSPSTCLLACPAGYYPYSPAMTCNSTFSSGTMLSLSLYFHDDRTIYADLIFNHPLNPSFGLKTFQNFTFSQNFDSALLNYSYQWLSSSSYRVVITPVDLIYLQKCTVTVTVMDMPSPVDYSADGVIFSSSVYSQQESLLWTIVPSSASPFKGSVVNTLQRFSDSVQEVTTLPYLQEFNKAGLVLLLLPGAQITSCVITTDSVYTEQMYEASRFWSNFVYFEVPAWEKDKQHVKYLFVPNADQAASQVRRLDSAQNIGRRLFDVNEVNWRFQRTGFTSIFLFDCYLQLIFIAVCWILVLVGGRIEDRCGWMVRSKVYPIFHALHQLMIFYFSMTLVLELIYFQPTSATRVVSLIFSLLANLYLLIYTLVVYYAFMKYPTLDMGSRQYRELIVKFGSFIRNIRHQDYEDSNDWLGKRLLRPYNYHLLAYYKKFLMILSVPMFLPYPTFLNGVLLGLQLLETVRFCLSWPFVSTCHNIYRLFLQFLLLVFFCASLAQCLLLETISQNNSATLPSATAAYEVTGWLGLISIFLFNILCCLQLMVNLIQHCCKSNREAVRQIRRSYYYDKIAKYEQSLENNISTDVLNTWVVKGDLNEKWIDDEQNAQVLLRVTVERMTVNVMGEGFLLQLEKAVDPEMGHNQLEDISRKIRVGRLLKGSVRVTKKHTPLLYQIILNVYRQHDSNYNSDFITIKTTAKIDPEKYKPGQAIRLSEEQLSQTVTISNPFENKIVKTLEQVMKGFPIGVQLIEDGMRAVKEVEEREEEDGEEGEEREEEE